MRILVTSREPLGVAGEAVMRVPSLGAPSSGASVTVDGLDSFDAPRLFLERARQVRPNLVVDGRACAHVVAVCRRLDGIPLALELAAARARSLPLDRLAEGLDDAFRLLTGGTRTALARQQTLHASIAWSVDLLDDEGRAVLRRLAVFRDGFSLEAAEAVVADGELVDQFMVLDVVGRPVDKSLVQLDDTTDRYRLLETIRQFAFDLLRDAGEVTATRARHSEWFTDVAVEMGGLAANGTLTPDSNGVTDVLAALEWAYDNAPSVAYRISRGLGWGRHRMGHFAEFARQFDWVASREGTDDPAGWTGAVAGLVVTCAIVMHPGYRALADRALGIIDPDDRSTRRLLCWPILSLEGLRSADTTALVAAWQEAIDDGDDIGRVRTPGRAYYRRKQTEDHSRKEATRALKRRISDAVYRHLVIDSRR